MKRDREPDAEAESSESPLLDLFGEIHGEIAPHLDRKALREVLGTNKALRTHYGLKAWQATIEKKIFKHLDLRPNAPATPSIARLISSFLMLDAEGNRTRTPAPAFYKLSVDALADLYVAIMEDLARDMADLVVLGKRWDYRYRVQIYLEFGSGDYSNVHWYSDPVHERPLTAFYLDLAKVKKYYRDSIQNVDHLLSMHQFEDENSHLLPALEFEMRNLIRDLLKYKDTRVRLRVGIVALNDMPNHAFGKRTLLDKNGVQHLVDGVYLSLKTNGMRREFAEQDYPDELNFY